jgi:hypothetical protein
MHRIILSFIFVVCVSRMNSLQSPQPWQGDTKNKSNLFRNHMLTIVNVLTNTFLSRNLLETRVHCHRIVSIMLDPNHILQEQLKNDIHNAYP